MTNIPKDPVMLLSYVNMKLRDFYPGPDELCAEISVSRKELDEKLESIGYVYDEKRNQYV